MASSAKKNFSHLRGGMTCFIYFDVHKLDWGFNKKLRLAVIGWSCLLSVTTRAVWLAAGARQSSVIFFRVK